MRWAPRDETRWHKWFAWYPVECRYGTTVWMETVWRRLRYPDHGSSIHEHVVFEERPDIDEARAANSDKAATAAVRSGG